MTKTHMDLSELLAKHDQGDFLRGIAEALQQLIMAFGFYCKRVRRSCASAFWNWLRSSCIIWNGRCGSPYCRHLMIG